MRLDGHGISSGIDKEVVVQRDITFPLKQPLTRRILIKEVAINFIEIIFGQALNAENGPLTDSVGHVYQSRSSHSC